MEAVIACPSVHRFDEFIWDKTGSRIPWAYPSSHPKRHLGWFSRFWSTVCKKVRLMLLDRCLSILSTPQCCNSSGISIPLLLQHWLILLVLTLTTMVLVEALLLRPLPK